MNSAIYSACYFFQYNQHIAGTQTGDIDVNEFVLVLYNASMHWLRLICRNRDISRLQRLTVVKINIAVNVHSQVFSNGVDLKKYNGEMWQFFATHKQLLDEPSYMYAYIGWFTPCKCNEPSGFHDMAIPLQT